MICAGDDALLISVLGAISRSNVCSLLKLRAKNATHELLLTLQHLYATLSLRISLESIYGDDNLDVYEP